jgi:signal transduction histidine kinase
MFLHLSLLHKGSCLNAMAEQLQALLDTRQKLATLEERYRLARDLHDSVNLRHFMVRKCRISSLLKKDK